MKIIQWVLDNLFTVLIIAGVLSQLIQAIKGKRAQGDEDGPVVEPPREAEFEDPELAERTRRIREDIRRKIAERQRGEGSPSLPSPEAEPAPVSQWGGEDETPPPLRREVVTEEAPPPLAMPAPAAAASSARFETQRQAEILEQQAAMQERLREIEAMKAAAQRRAAFEALSVSQTTVEREKTRGAVLEDLRDPQALRRAFILREVLGPPVSLR